MSNREGRNHRKQTEKLHRERVEGNGHKPKYSKKQGEAEVVPLYQLSAVLRAWRDRWRADRDLDLENDVMGALAWLEQESGVNVRRISAIMSEDKKVFREVVGLSTADRLLQAAGLTGYLYDQIQVVPNPNWSFEQWIDYMQERGC